MDGDAFFEEGIDVMSLFEPVPLPDWHPAMKHFGHGQNDARVLGIEIGREFLEVTFNHYDVQRLASMLLEKADAWRSLQATFPVTLRFGGVSQLEIHRIIENGVYQKIRTSQRALRLADISEMQCVHYEAEVQHYVLQIHGAGTPYNRYRGQDRHGWYTNSYYLCIAAPQLEANERYREGWIKVFDGKNLDILDAFESVWPVPRWSMKDFSRWLEELT